MNVQVIGNKQAETSHAFKGNYKKNEHGSLYYHTNSAIKIGGFMAGISAVGSLIELSSDSFLNNTYNKLLKESKPATAYKSKKTSIIIRGLISIAINLGCAAFIDYKRNQKAKETVDYVKRTGTKNALNNRNDISISNRGRAYYDSNTGSKYGAWLGAGAGIISSIATYITENNSIKQLEKQGKKIPDEIKKLQKSSMAIGTIVSIGISALGGWLLGKWSDHIANKDAQKHA